jgi:PadR family transcriptional regulator, regulatory protein PadR
MTDSGISYSIMTTQPPADVLREAKKGSAELVILALLEDTPRHGYELAARIEQESDGALSYNFASLYATLYKLEGRGWVQGRWVERAGQRRRRYYRLTPAGAAVLGRQRDEWKLFVLALGRLAGISFA